MNTLTDTVVAVPSTKLEEHGRVLGPDGKPVVIFKDTTFNPTYDKVARINGRVVLAPLKPDAMQVDSIYEGYPLYGTYKSHEKIHRQVQRISPRDIGVRKFYERSYRPALHEPESITADMAEADIMEGEEVWFHFNALSDNRWLQYDAKAKEHHYHIPYSEIFMTKGRWKVRNHIHQKYIMLNNYVLIEPYYGKGLDEEIDVHGKKVKVRTKKVGNLELVVELSEKPKYLHGIVKAIGDPVGPDHRNSINPNDKVIFLPKSEFENTIEDTTYYIMRQSDIVAAAPNENVFVPVGDYVMLHPDKFYHEKLQHYVQGQKVEEGKILLRDVDLPRPDTGVVIDKGELCGDEVESGDKVHLFGRSSFFVALPDGRILVRYKDIMCKKI